MNIYNNLLVIPYYHHYCVFATIFIVKVSSLKLADVEQR